MATRIRYRKHDTRDNVVESTHIFVSARHGGQYIVRLDLNNYTYEIKNIKKEVIYRGGEKINNLNVLKRQARKRLTDLGVILNSEDRDRSFGMCKKGYTQKKHVENKYEGLRGITGIECW